MLSRQGACGRARASSPLILAGVFAGVFALACVSAGCERGATTGQPAATTASPTPSPRLADGLFTPAQMRTISAMRISRAGAPTDETNRVFTDARAQKLGQRLFFDERMSAVGEISCASCHQPGHGFAMPAPLGQGIGVTPRHVPHLLGVAHSPWFDWDGKADTLWAQAVRPIESPAEHGFTRVEVVRLIATDPTLKAEYEAIFGALPPVTDARFPKQARPVVEDPEHAHHKAWMGMSAEDRAAIDRAFTNATKAIAAYEGLLTARPSAFDRYAEALVSGRADHPDLKALSPAARRGLSLFTGRALCTNCHNGPHLSDFAFHNLGLPPARHQHGARDEGRWLGTREVKRRQFNARSEWSDDRQGRRAQWLTTLTRTPEDHGQFKTPSLRNVSRTPPYMHGGHFERLEEVVAFYNALPGQAQLGHREDALRALALTAQEQADLVAFLKSLDSAPLPPELLGAPEK